MSIKDNIKSGLSNAGSKAWSVAKTQFAAMNPYARMMADLFPGYSFNMIRGNNDYNRFSSMSSMNDFDDDMFKETPKSSNTRSKLKNNFTPDESSSLNQESSKQLSGIQNSLGNIDKTLKEMESKEKGKSASSKKMLEKIHEMLLAINTSIQNTNKVSTKVSKGGKSTNNNSNNNLDDIHEMLLVINSTLESLDSDKKTNINIKKYNSDNKINIKNTRKSYKASKETINNVKELKKTKEKINKEDNKSKKKDLDFNENNIKTKNDVLSLLCAEVKSINSSLSDLGNETSVNISSVIQEEEEKSRTTISDTINTFSQLFRDFDKKHFEEIKTYKAILRKNSKSYNTHLSSISGTLERILSVNEEMYKIQNEISQHGKTLLDLQKENDQKQKIKDEIAKKESRKGYIRNRIEEFTTSIKDGIENIKLKLINGVEKAIFETIISPYTVNKFFAKSAWSHFIKPFGEEIATGFKMWNDARKSRKKDNLFNRLKDATENGNKLSQWWNKKRLSWIGVSDGIIDMVSKGTNEDAAELFMKRVENKNKAVAFDSEVKDSIVTGIPLLLSKIYEALSGKESYWSYEKGGLTSKEDYIESKLSGAKYRNIELENQREKRFFLFNKGGLSWLKKSKKAANDLDEAQMLAESNTGVEDHFGSSVNSLKDLYEENGMKGAKGIRKKGRSTLFNLPINLPFRALWNTPQYISNLGTKLIDKSNDLDEAQMLAESNTGVEVKTSDNRSFMERLFDLFSTGEAAVYVTNLDGKIKRRKNKFRFMTDSNFNEASSFFEKSVNKSKSKEKEKVEKQNNKYLKEISKSTTEHEKEFKQYSRWQKLKNMFGLVSGFATSLISGVTNIVSGITSLPTLLVAGMATLFSPITKMIGSVLKLLGFKKGIDNLDSLDSLSPDIDKNNIKPNKKKESWLKRGLKFGGKLAPLALAGSFLLPSILDNKEESDVNPEGSIDPINTDQQELTSGLSMADYLGGALGAASLYTVGKTIYNKKYGGVTPTISPKATNGAKPKGLWKGGLRVIGNGLKAIPYVGQLASLGFALYDGVNSAFDDDIIKEQTGKNDVSFSDRLKHGSLGALTGLVNWIPGLESVNATNTLNLFEKIGNYVGGYGFETNKERNQYERIHDPVTERKRNWIGNIIDFFSPNDDNLMTERHNAKRQLELNKIQNLKEEYNDAKDIVDNANLTTYNKEYIEEQKKKMKKLEAKIKKAEKKLPEEKKIKSWTDSLSDAKDSLGNFFMGRGLLTDEELKTDNSFHWGSTLVSLFNPIAWLQRGYDTYQGAKSFGQSWSNFFNGRGWNNDEEYANLSKKEKNNPSVWTKAASYLNPWRSEETKKDVVSTYNNIKAESSKLIDSVTNKFQQIYNENGKPLLDKYGKPIMDIDGKSLLEKATQVVNGEGRKVSENYINSVLDKVRTSETYKQVNQAINESVKPMLDKVTNSESYIKMKQYVDEKGKIVTDKATQFYQQTAQPAINSTLETINNSVVKPINNVFSSNESVNNVNKELVNQTELSLKQVDALSYIGDILTKIEQNTNVSNLKEKVSNAYNVTVNKTKEIYNNRQEYIDSGKEFLSNQANKIQNALSNAGNQNVNSNNNVSTTQFGTSVLEFARN